MTVGMCCTQTLIGHFPVHVGKSKSSNLQLLCGKQFTEIIKLMDLKGTVEEIVVSSMNPL